MAGSPVPSRHSCGAELREEERRAGLYGRFGMILECSCGVRYELRRSSFFRWAVGVGPGNHDSRYSPIQYWHGLGWGVEQ